MDERKWLDLQQQALSASAICFIATDEYQLSSCARRLTEYLQQQWNDSELTRIPGEEFTLEEAFLAAGTISFFSTRRLIRVDRLQLSALSDSDIAEFCNLLQDTENAIFVITILCKSDKDKTTKKAKQLENAVCSNGKWINLPTLYPGDAKKIAVQLAKDQGAKITDAAAQLLADNSDGDLFLLSNEVAKLAAGADYQTVDPSVVESLGSHTVEADVFKMVEAVAAGRIAPAFDMLNRLLYLRNEPVAIAAALTTGYIDMIRVKTAAAHHLGYSAVQTQLHYTGNDYRLKKASQNASRYSVDQLREAVSILLKLDVGLKSSPLDYAVQLQTALCELCALIG